MRGNTLRSSTGPVMEDVCNQTKILMNLTITVRNPRVATSATGGSFLSYFSLVLT